MELGTEDIFLEANRKPGSVVQRFGNEGPGGGADAKTFSNALAAGMTIMNSTNRRAIVRVRPVPAPGSAEEQLLNGGGTLRKQRSSNVLPNNARVLGASTSQSFGGGSVAALGDEGLEHRLNLAHLRRIAPFFLVAPSVPSKASSTHHSQPPSPAAGAGATDFTAFAQALTTLQRRCENQLWLHGPPPIPAGTLSQLVPKKPEQFTHVGSAVSSSTAAHRHTRETRSLEELKAREFNPKALLEKHHREERAQRLKEKQDSGNSANAQQQQPSKQNHRIRQATSPNTSSCDSDVDDPAESSGSGSAMHHPLAQQQTSLGDGDVRDLLRELFSRPKRALTEQQFVQAVLESRVSTASASSAQQLFRKIDVESSGEISFDAFLTFLVSNQSGGGAGGASSGDGGGGGNPATAQSSELVPMSVPRSCPPWHQHERLISTMTVSPRTGIVFTGGCDGSLRSWDPVTLRHQKLWYTCNSWIIGIVFTYREQRLIICTVDRQVVVFDAKSGDVLRLYRGRRVIETENGLSFAHESIPVVTVGGKIISHAAPKGVKIRRSGSSKHSSSAMQSLEHPPGSDGGGKGAPAGAKLGAMSFEQYRAMLEEEKNNQLERRRLEEYILAGLTEPPSCIEYHYSKADEDVLFFGMDDGSIRIFIIPTTQQRLVRQHFRLRPHKSRIRRMQVIPQLEALLTCSDDGSLKLTNLTTGQIVKDFSRDGHESSVTCFAYSSVMKLFISSGGERHGFVWDQLQETPVARLDEHPCPTLACAINEAEWQFITIGADNSVYVFSARTYKLLQQFHERVRPSNGGQLSQVPVAAPGGSSSTATLMMAHAASTANHNLYSVSVFDGPRQRLLLGTTFPVMHQLRRNVATLPANYCGHTSPVVATLFNSIFHVVITIDAEHLVLGWEHGTGKSSGLSFSISSFASPHDDLRLTACALDVMQRRLITGFQVGTVVVWNVFNGQSLCVIKASGCMPLSGGGLPSSRRKGGKRRTNPQPAGDAQHTTTQDNSSGSSDSRSDCSDDGSSGGSDSAKSEHRKRPTHRRRHPTDKNHRQQSSSSSVDVIAVAALQRDSTHYIFSLGQTLVTLKETPSFTVANPPRFRVPWSVGTVAVLSPCSPVLVACGTTSGAVVFFNIASESLDGNPLWADDTAVRTSVAQQLVVASTSSSSKGGVVDAFPDVNPSGSPASLVRGSVDDDHGVVFSPAVLAMLCSSAEQQAGAVMLSRIVALFPLRHCDHSMLLALHADGKLVLWNIVHRRCVGVFSAAPQLPARSLSSFSEHGQVHHMHATPINILNASIDQSEEFLVHADDGGNITVLKLTFSVVPQAACGCGPGGLTATSNTTSAAPVHRSEAEAVVHVTPFVVLTEIITIAHFFGLTASITALCVTKGDENCPRTKMSSPGQSPPGPRSRAAGQQSPSRRGGGEGRGTLPRLSLGPNVADAENKQPNGGGQQTGGLPSDESIVLASFESPTPRSSSSAAAPSAVDVPCDVTIVSTSTDFFSRVFDLYGHHIGDLGMHQWSVAHRSTFVAPNRVLSPLLPMATAGSAFPEDAGDDGGPLREDLAADDFLATLLGGPFTAKTGALGGGKISTSPQARRDGQMSSPLPRRESFISHLLGGKDDVLISVTKASATPYRSSALDTGVSKPQQYDGYVLPAVWSPMHGEGDVLRATSSLSQACQAGRAALSQTPRSSSTRVRTQRAGIVKVPTGGAGCLVDDGLYFGSANTTRMSFSSDGAGADPQLPSALPSPNLAGSKSVASSSMRHAIGSTNHQVNNSSMLSCSARNVASRDSPGQRTLAPQTARTGGNTSVLGAGPRMMTFEPHTAQPPPQQPSQQRTSFRSSIQPVRSGAPQTEALSGEAARTSLLTGHLERQLQRLQSCKPDLNQELRRIETRLRKGGSEQSGGDGDGGLSTLSWTSRVAARLELHELDDIQPPAGSRASNDAGRRTHNRIRQLNQRGGGGAQGGGGGGQQGGVGGGQQRADFFPSVTAPGTILVGINDGADEEELDH